MFTIVTDTSANLPAAYIEREHIIVVPFTFHAQGKELSCLDPGSFDAGAFYGGMRAGVSVTTSQIPPQRFVDALTPILEQGEDVLLVSMSSGISGSCSSAMIAAAQLGEEYPQRRIYVVDTLSASLGEGLLVMEGAACRREGMSIEAVYERLCDLRHSMGQIFTVDDLRYLRGTGRLSNLGAVVGTVLHIKPLLMGNEEGKIVCFAKHRGRKRSIEAIAERYEQLVVAPERQIVGIAHADCEADAALLASLISRSRPPREILTVDYEPVTGSHVGPGALALFFLSDSNVRRV